MISIIVIGILIIIGYRINIMFITFNPHGDQIHIALTGKPSEMVVSWITHTNKDCGHVEYGVQFGIYTSQIDATCKTSTEGAWWNSKWVGMIHEALLYDLTPNTQYYYKIVRDEWSQEYSFKTATQEFVDFTFGVVADQSHKAAATAVISQMIDAELDLAIMPGDLSYAGGDSKEWDEWFNLIEPFAAKVPCMVIPGNHDEPYDYEAYLGRFRMPATESSGTEFYYSFNYGSVHFVSLSSQHSLNPDNAQYKWLENDLKSANLNRSANPWIIVQIHEPMYSSVDGHGSNTKIRKTLEPLLQLYNIDIVFSGHDHGYERTFPVYDGVPTDGAPIHILTGTGGRPLTGFKNQPVWSNERISEFGFTQVHVVGNTSILIEFIDINGMIRDSVELFR